MSNTSDAVLVTDALVSSLSGGVNAGNAAISEGSGAALGVAQTTHAVIDLSTKGIQNSSAVWGRYVPIVEGVLSVAGLK